MSASVVARFSVEQACAQAISDRLAECFDPGQVVTCAFEQQNGGWSLALYFRDPPSESAVRTLVALAAGAAAAKALRFERLAAKDWVRASLAGLQPVEAGRFIVHGAHARGQFARNRVGIEIDAALAFGTGHHGTTRGCLLMLDRIVKRQRPRRVPGRVERATWPVARTGRGVLDIGTGSAVLAIAAARTLRARVLAGDVDLGAVKIARENTRRNGVGALVEVVHGAGVAAPRIREYAPYRLVFANILLAPLVRLAAPIARLIAPNGRAVLSGVLPAQANAALAPYRAHGFMLEQRISLEGWTTLVLRAPAARVRLPLER